MKPYWEVAKKRLVGPGHAKVQQVPYSSSPLEYLGCPILVGVVQMIWTSINTRLIGVIGGALGYC